MSLYALALVVTAAFFHAAWNLLAKRISSRTGGGSPLVFLTSLWVTILYLPAAIWVMAHESTSLGLTAWLWICLSACLHYGYSLVLQRGYEKGDLSVVYPLARGTGPLLSSIGAIFVLGERPGWLAACGIVLVICGVLLLAGGRRLFRRSAFRSNLEAGVGWRLLTGVFIATYTLVDGYGVKVLLIAPLLLDYFSGVVRAALSAPRALTQRPHVALLWQRHKKEIIGIALLSPLSYILVLTALQEAPVSHVAPARELSMMVAAFLGVRLLNEGDMMQRMAAAGLIVAGVIALTLG